MSDPADRPYPSPVPYPFPLVPAGQLRRGDLIHLAGSTYLLVADVRVVDDARVEVSVFDGDQPRPETRHRECAEMVEVAHRGVAAPLTAAGAAAQARRREAVFALMDSIRTSIGPVTGVDEEIDRIRGRDPAPVPPDPIHGRTTSDLVDVLARHRGDGPLLLDVDQPAVRAVLALFAELKDGEDPDGGWNGADAVDTLTRWLERIGIDPATGPDRLEARCARGVD